jgi:anhydro-N-acetylmuramic acid kinase
MSADLYLGIMSGTSLDGIDVAACRFDGKHIDLLVFHSVEWQPGLRERIMELATAERIDMNDLVRAHFELAREYATAVEAILRESDISSSHIRAIGLHGQTIRHLPSISTSPLAPLLHKERGIGATLQLGSGAALAAITGIDVVSDFRAADIALGGQGAPLVPMFDYYFLRSDSTDRLIVNIGGIANVTWLPRMIAHAAHAEASDVIAFDCGPGNMLLDSITRHHFGKPYDENGDIARTGKIDQAFLDEFLSNPYFALPPPKSTGRELFSENFLDGLNEKIADRKLLPQDALTTLTELTALSIMRSFEFLQTKSSEIEIIISGGGAFNTFLLERMKANALSYTNVSSSDDFGIPAKAKEAIAFAFFAHAFVEAIPIHLPKTTGASRQTTLGCLSRGK